MMGDGEATVQGVPGLEPDKHLVIWATYKGDSP